MASEDLTTYTKVDTNNRLTVTPARVTWTNLGDDETAYLYKDKGANFFNGDFTHLLTARINTSQTNTLKAGWVLANAVDDLNQLDIDNENYLALMLQTSGSGAGTPKFTVYEHTGGMLYIGGSILVNYDTPYYLTIKRVEADGTYGTLYLYVYSDSARTVLVGQSSYVLHEKVDFRYIYAVNSRNDGTVQEQSGYAENLDLQLSATVGGINPGLLEVMSPS